ncbi:Guanylate-binding protein 4 [Camelus dromedarius]|uniref:Guanylate-binding protein 4 n=1 Tax=Camelus dromedarius TaxID=9838 RepID=A0A5N4DDG4_CAMDR|nr:Guanylate-binding protein 4 [Camelus dromedarius]
MASGPSMMNPICLVKRQNSQMTVNPNALKILEQISQPVVVVAIVGPYRTGKSYLMNRLVGQNHGFSLGSTVRSETKGIWMWCVPHPSKESHALVLLDTEGLGDVEKGDSKSDLWTFALAVLLSSCFVYNSMSTINHQALEQLHSDDGEDSADFVRFFPDFIWTVRDFTLELELDGCPITEDEYLENALRLIPGKDPQVQHSNMPREMIRSFFPKRKCFVFDRPVRDRKLLVCIEDVPDDQLDESFQMQCQDFCSYVFTHAKAKTLGEGITVTGGGLGTLVVAYVDTINSGAVPCLENAVMTLAERENSVAVEKAAAHYSEQMAQRVTLPTDTLQGLLDVHAACEREAIAVFMEHSFKDDKREFQKKLVEKTPLKGSVIRLLLPKDCSWTFLSDSFFVSDFPTFSWQGTIQKKKEEFLVQNEEASVKYCQAELQKLSEPLTEHCLKGTFFAPGGHKLYLEARDKLEQGYMLVPRKGVKANEVLQSFLQSQAGVEEAILQADKALTDGEKAVAVERAKKQAAERKQELLKEKQNEEEQKLAMQEQSLKENLAQLEEKMDREREDLLRQQERVLEHKLKTQEELLRDGFKKNSEALTSEISKLKEDIETTKNNYPFKMSEALDAASITLVAVLPGPYKAAGLGLKMLSEALKRSENSS